MLVFEAGPLVLEPVGFAVPWAGAAIASALGALWDCFVTLFGEYDSCLRLRSGLGLKGGGTLMRRSRHNEQPVLWGTPTMVSSDCRWWSDRSEEEK